MVEIGSVVLEKKIFKVCQCLFALFVNITPWKKGMALHLKKFYPKEWFLPSLVEIGPMVLEKNMKRWKVYGQMDNMQSEKLPWPFSSVELKKQQKKHFQYKTNMAMP